MKTPMGYGSSLGRPRRRRSHHEIRTAVHAAEEPHRREAEEGWPERTFEAQRSRTDLTANRLRTDSAQTFHLLRPARARCERPSPDARLCRICGERVRYGTLEVLRGIGGTEPVAVRCEGSQTPRDHRLSSH